MVSHQIICKILAEGSLDILFSNGIDLELFPMDYKEELRFIINHANKYGNVPDTLTFLAEFNEFDIVEVTEKEEYLIDKLMEAILYQKQVAMANEYGEKLGESDSRNAFRYLKQEMEKIKKIEQKTSTVEDIVQDVSRGESYTKKVEQEELFGISTGSELLDEVLHGWLEEDLVIILGRTNEGKSWILNFFLVTAWQNGNRVLLYSGEMSSEIIGYRFDTLNEHFSNTGLMAGSEDLGEEHTKESYVEYLGNLKQSETPFMIVTPKTLGKKLDVPTLKYLIEVHEPDIIGVDQISLMEDYRSTEKEQLRIQYGNIAEDLYALSEETRKPILAPAQANRSAQSKNNGKDGQVDKPPETHEISESDGIGQAATRVISILRSDLQLTLYVAKNRYGVRGEEANYLWDINLGIFKPFNTPKVPQAQIPIEVVDGQGGIASGEELF